MATYRTIAATETNPEAPITSALMKALDGNLSAVGEKDPSVPVGVRLGLWLLGAGVTASGTQIDFTGIPARARRVTVLLSGVSHNSGASQQFQLQLGTSGGIEATGYTGSFQDPIVTAVAAAFSTSFVLTKAQGQADLVHGRIVLECIDPATNLWVANGQFHNASPSLATSLSGSKALSAALDRVRLLVTAGSFDVGIVNVSWE